ncbi:hypothetical protein TRFO_29855 [Tritrichomonas foetus]|uniref:Uncharacterized protein n=1 Tax=Tritrichomonas foetus TaxID=1144522 RepID=A0A1J4JWT8_9EUKA|nr:hypothetical protein TRFO_29855 [Tritrichomonas foetus]|eukprot:OHT02920.1 hypothetical protein TRFO_29855 [Tritrichomonas foetus]
MSNELEDVIKFVSKPLSRTFSVAIDNSHSTKLKCDLYGIILVISDPDRIETTKCLYLTQWNNSTRRSGQHKSLIFQPLVNSDIRLLKLKARSSKTIDEWAHQIETNKEIFTELKVNNAIFHARLNINGHYDKITISVNSYKIILSKGGYVVDLPRSSDILCMPVFDNPRKLRIYKNMIPIQTLLCKDEFTARKICIVINTQPNAVNVIPEVLLEDQIVPDVDDLLGDSLSAHTVNEIGMNTDNKTTNLQSMNQTYTDNSNKSIKSQQNVIMDDLSQFDEAMSVRLEYFDQMPMNEVPPTRQDAILEIIRNDVLSTRSQYGDYPTINAPDVEDEEQLFNVPKEPFYNSLHSINIAQQSIIEYSLQKQFDFPNLYHDLIDKIQFPSSTNTSIKVNNDNDFKHLMNEIISANENELFLYVVGTFVQGKKVSLSTLSSDLGSIKFPIIEISNIINDSVFHDFSTLFLFFAKLSNAKLIGTFFRSLEYLHDFKEKNYGYDALIRVERFCTNVASIFEKPMIMPKNWEIDNIPIAKFEAIHLNVGYSVERFISTQSNVWFAEDEDSIINNPMNNILGNLILLCASDLKIYDGDFKDLYSLLFKVSSRFLREEREIWVEAENLKITRSQKVLMFFINAIMTRLLNKWMMMFMFMNKKSPERIKSTVVALSLMEPIYPVFTEKCLNNKQAFVIHAYPEVKKMIINYNKTV